MLRSGQSMIESVIAVLIVVLLFLAMFRLSRVLTSKILVEHAAMRVARARAVGFNRFMCEKAARICVIPVAGKREWPLEDDPRRDVDAVALSRMYMRTPDSSHADGLLRYDGWKKLDVGLQGGTVASPKMRFSLFEEDDRSHFEWTIKGNAEVDSLPMYLEDRGL